MIYSGLVLRWVMLWCLDGGKGHYFMLCGGACVSYHSTYTVVFFFSSRRRHTRYIGDWSSDGALPILVGACSSGPRQRAKRRCSTYSWPRAPPSKRATVTGTRRSFTPPETPRTKMRPAARCPHCVFSRSEERRVGKSVYASGGRHCTTK